MATVGRPYALRMILLGEAGVGKSSLYHWIKYKAFRDASINTGDEEAPSTSTHTSGQRQYDQHNVHINITPSFKVILTVVDTADGEKFQSLTAQYYRRTNIVLLVCSLDDEISFNRLTKWYQESRYYIDEQDVVYAVCGLKSDLHPHQREITLEMMQGFAQHVEFPENCVFEVSAKTGSGIADMLKTVCSTAVERIRRHTQDRHCECHSIYLLHSVPGGRGIVIACPSILQDLWV
jgi:small GTP-binding protein